MGSPQRVMLEQCEAQASRVEGVAKGGLLEADDPTRVGDAGQRTNRKAYASSVQHYMLRITDLLALNARGIFPGPTENPDNFCKRAAQCQKKIFESEAFNDTCELFDATPDWVEVKNCKQGLHFWEGAATWIEENEAKEKNASIQIKPSLPSFLYSHKEVLSHELVHAMRLGFDEERFEEILAYQTSKNKLRRYLGPLFTKPIEIKFFFLLMLISWADFWTEWVFDIELASQWMLWLPLFALGVSFCRLIYFQRIFSKALKNLEKTMSQPGKSLAVALRLSDQEIMQFAKSSTSQIIAYVNQEKERDLRWKQLAVAYF
jgi:hypothetical protein